MKGILYVQEGKHSHERTPVVLAEYLGLPSGGSAGIEVQRAIARSILGVVVGRHRAHGRMIEGHVIGAGSVVDGPDRTCIADKVAVSVVCQSLARRFLDGD